MKVKNSENSETTDFQVINFLDLDARKGQKLPPIKIKAINVETDETFNYESISKAAKDLNIHPGLISKVLQGKQNGTLIKKDNKRFTFEKILS